ncbi:hypothetical protein LJY25_01515 [Hymenobacter sp. BT175]|uniref:hypothetical protein n=1 Tax=Hymenobacter translucens TaxID=2886507 RepID=UPI001D0E6AC0|nr:hypothetical protein [Hymenobacter translucens]MCC2545109.1 hypothetical protein [Hymenobacter translucens]
MNRKSFFTASIIFTALVALSIWSGLVWAHFHGGVSSHHLLADEKLPALSNWWGALILPLLTWFLLYRIRENTFREEGHSSLLRPLYGFIGAVLFGGLISVLFTLGENDLAGNAMLLLFVAALVYPVYRPECLLGFVLSMSYVFGPVLPALIGILVGGIALVLYALVRPAGQYVAAKLALVISFSNARHKD